MNMFRENIKIITQSEPNSNIWKYRIKSLYDNKIEQADRAREFKLAARLGTSMNI